MIKQMLFFGYFCINESGIEKILIKLDNMNQKWQLPILGYSNTENYKSAIDNYLRDLIVELNLNDVFVNSDFSKLEFIYPIFDIDEIELTNIENKNIE